MEKTKVDHKSRFLELDVFRGLAALYVLGFHYAAFGHHINSSEINISRFITGVYGVQLFFIISGFVIFMTLENTKRPLDFIVSRFSRLYPGYWVAIVLAFIIYRFSDTWPAVSLHAAIINFSMIQHWIGVDHVDGVYWTLSLELAFYVFMFTLFVTKKLKYIEFFGLAWLCLMVLHTKVGFTAPKFLDIDNLLKFGNLFFAGIIFYKMKTDGSTWYRYLYLGLCLLVQSIVKIEVHHGYFIDPIFGTLIILGFFTAFYLFIFDKLSFIVIPPLIFLGEISYSLYLTHASISTPIIKYLFNHSFNPIFIILIPFCCAVGVASIITYAIERPAMNYIRAIYRNSS